MHRSTVATFVGTTFYETIMHYSMFALQEAEFAGGKGDPKILKS